MRGLILAAGAGIRLHPITKYVPKSLLHIDGKPAIEQVIKSFSECDISDIVIVTRHLKEQIEGRIRDGKKLGVKIAYRKQGVLNGTSKAVEAAQDFISGDVLVAASDCLLPTAHIKTLIKYHSSENCDLTLSLKVLNTEEIQSSATVSLEENGTITRIIEKPNKNEILSNISASPYYICNERIIEYLHLVEPSKRGEYELASVIQMMIDDGRRIKGLISESWKHLSDLNDLISLNPKTGPRDVK